jgi:hypothetical protein
MDKDTPNYSLVQFHLNAGGSIPKGSGPGRGRRKRSTLGEESFAGHFGSQDAAR